MLLQSLEDRRCLAADPAFVIDLPELQIDPTSHATSSLIVRYGTEGHQSRRRCKHLWSFENYRQQIAWFWT